MIKPLIFGRVKKGKLIFERPVEVALRLQSLNGEQVQVTIEKRRKNRSNNENNYMWGVVIPILAEHFGYDNEEMHEALKWLFLRKHKDGRPDTCRSTTELSTVEFEEYMSKIRMWASSEWEVNIPEPNEVDWE